MRGRSTLFEGDAGSPSAPRLDPSGKAGGSAFALTPNRLIGVSRLALALLLPTAMILGPDGLGGVELQFAAAYGVAILTMLSFRRFGTRDIAGALALLFGARWAFSALTDGTTIAMLLTQLAGIGCALAPVQARNVGRLAGPTEGHISFTERRAMWRDRSSKGGAATGVAPSGAPVPTTPVVALLEYRSSKNG